MGVLISYLPILVMVLNILLGVTIVFFEGHDTAQTWAWLLVLTFLPIIGFILYLFFGRGISKKKAKRFKNYDRLLVNDQLVEQADCLTKKLKQPLENNQRQVTELKYLLSVYNDALLTEHNDVKLYTEGQQKFTDLIQDIKTAKDHIHLQYYIYRGDALGVALKEALVAAAKRGVKVKVLLDAWGCSRLPQNFFNELEVCGGEVRLFFPIFLPYINPRLQYRNHRKIVVIDGTISYVGGLNVGDEYLGKVAKFGYWRDNHLRLVGDATHALQRSFIRDWNAQGECSFSPNYFPTIPSTGTKNIQIITSGPETGKEEIKIAYIKLIQLAQEEILIQSPYFIPDNSVYEALKIAILSGITVRLQIPNKPDHPLVYWGTYYYAGSLAQLGGQVETYEKGFMHSKTVIIDGKLLSIGTANMDNRSFRSNFEVNALLYDEEIAQQAQQAFYQDSHDSLALTSQNYAKRSWSIRLKEGLARLISPLL